MTDKNIFFTETSGAEMTTFNLLQRGIWESSKQKAVLVGLCKKGCDWLSDDGVCVSSMGCMYSAQDKN